MNLCIISWKGSPNILRSSWLVKLNKCAQEFSSALETELTSNSITVDNTVKSAYNLVKTTTDSTKIDISAIELAALKTV